MGPAVDDHEARWALSDAKADPRVSVGSTKTLDACQHLHRASNFVTDI